MIVLCNKIISPATSKDLGSSSTWLTREKEYLVLSVSLSANSGLNIYIQTDHHDEPSFFCMDGFEIVSQKIPSSWITTVEEVKGKKVITMLPENWNYETFF